MRWLFQRGEDNEQQPMLLTLHDASAVDEPAGIRFVPGQALAITARTAGEARNALGELQRVQRELVAVRAGAATSTAAAVGSAVKRQVTRAGEAGRALAPRRSHRAPATQPALRQAQPDTFGNAVDALSLAALSTDLLDESIKLVGAALDALGDAIKSIDIGTL
jgi:hypothetical protein